MRSFEIDCRAAAAEHCRQALPELSQKVAVSETLPAGVEIS